MPKVDNKVIFALFNTYCTDTGDYTRNKHLGISRINPTYNGRSLTC